MGANQSSLPKSVIWWAFAALLSTGLAPGCDRPSGQDRARESLPDTSPRITIIPRAHERIASPATLPEKEEKSPVDDEPNIAIDPHAEYEFVLDNGRRVNLIQGDTEARGTLDTTGNFMCEIRYKRGQPLASAPLAGPLINDAQKGVYEYRSGRLILGDIDKEGNFIPTVGEKVIDFKDYRYDPKGPKIYNLPGTFVRKGEKEEKK